MSKPLISVVIPAYNYAHVLPRAVESVINQLADDGELLVINDGSTDNTDKVVATLLEKHQEKLSYIKTENSGASATRNRGIDETTGEYLVFLDADDELTADGLDIFRQGVHHNPTSKMIMAGHISVHESGKETYHAVKTFPEDSEERLRGYLLEKTIGLSNGAVIIHREIFDGYRYNPAFRNSEDLPMFAFVLANYPVSVEDKPAVRIHKHDDSLRHNVERAKDVGMNLVDEVFDSGRIPKSAMGLKKAFAVQRYLSLSRTCFMAGDFESCVVFYRKALSSDWRALKNFSYGRKALKACFHKRCK